MISCTLQFIKNYFDNLIETYEKLYLVNLEYKKYTISYKELVYCIEDSFILYVCIESTTIYGNVEYQIKMEELLPNNVFKFIISKFLNNFENTYYTVFYKKFIGFNNHAQKGYVCELTTLDTINMIDKKIPQLNLQNRVNAWDGFLYHLFFFEISSTDYKTYTMCCSQSSGGYSAAYNKCNNLYNACISLLYNYKGMSNKNHFYSDGFMFDRHAYVTISEILKQGNVNKLHNKVKFWFSDEYLTDCIDIKAYQIQKLDSFINSELYYNDSFLYETKPVKWKSEYMVYELAKKIYGESNVIFQFKPYYLRYEGKQLSYDIYIPKKKVAIEYQGQQHFMPINYFGGEYAFKKQKERDNIKLELSQKNNIKLIYINYWEDITIDLIKNKIKT